MTMKEFSAADLARGAADLFEAACVAPVAITKHRKPRFVVMTLDRYHALTGAKVEERPFPVAVDVTDMPPDIAERFDEGMEAYFRERDA